jgi:hypothetical protein
VPINWRQLRENENHVLAHGPIAKILAPLIGRPCGRGLLPDATGAGANTFGTADKTTLRGFLDRIEQQYGKARRVWLMDRGVPTEEVLAEMRAADPPVHYLVGTPRGRLTRLEKHLVAKPWQEARPACRSSSWRKKASSTSWRKAATASPKSGQCADAS